MAWPKFVRFAMAAVLLGILGLSGCETVGSGGAPKLSYNVDEDLAAHEKHFSSAAKLDEIYKNPTEAKRNEFIAGRLVLINIQYLRFIKKTTSEKQCIDAATDILVLSLNLVGTTGVTTDTKTILHAISAGLEGSKTTVDKHYYYEKTVPALVAAMNAQRKNVLKTLIVGRGKSLDEYPFEKALCDLYDYYMAGTFAGAIQTIQVDAGVKEAQADERIQKEIERQFGPRWKPGADQEVVNDLIDRLRKIQEDKEKGKDRAQAVLDAYKKLCPEASVSDGDAVIVLGLLVADTANGKEGTDLQKLKQAFDEAEPKP